MKYHGLISVTFGLMFAIGACSAIKAVKGNAQIQTQGVTPKYHLNTSLPYVPALNILPNSNQNKQDIRPFKDSLINGLKNIRQAIDNNGRKLDTGLKRQTNYMDSQAELMHTVSILVDNVSDLKNQNQNLTQKATVTKAIKDDAVFGNTFKKFAVFLLIFIAVGIVGIIILQLFLHRNLSESVKRIQKNHAT